MKNDLARVLRHFGVSGEMLKGGITHSWSAPLAMNAADFYEHVQRGDFVELLWIDGKRQVKVYGCVQFVGTEKPIGIVARNGDEWVLYRLALEDRAVIIERN